MESIPRTASVSRTDRAHSLVSKDGLPQVKTGSSGAGKLFDCPLAPSSLPAILSLSPLSSNSWWLDCHLRPPVRRPLTLDRRRTKGNGGGENPTGRMTLGMAPLSQFPKPSSSSWSLVLGSHAFHGCWAWSWRLLREAFFYLFYFSRILRTIIT